MILLVKNSKWLCLCGEQTEGTDGEGVVTIDLQTVAHSEGRKLRGSRRKRGRHFNLLGFFFCGFPEENEKVLGGLIHIVDL